MSASPAAPESGSEIILAPRTPPTASRSRIARFMAAHGISSLAELQQRSVADPEWYWDAVSRDLGLSWTRPYRRVLDASRGPAWPRWFEGGLLNFTENCVDRHASGPRRSKAALIWEGDDGQTRTLTYAELAREVNRLANALRRLGVGRGDTVGVFLPMSPEAAIATLAVARLGAVYTPCFSGYGAQAVASRLQDCEAKVLVTADSFYRRGQVVRLKQTADEAADASPTVKHVIVYQRLGQDVPWTPGRDHWWHDIVAGESSDAPAEAVEADHPCLIIYTSGTTGRPKGAVLTQGGFLVKCAHDFALRDRRRRRRSTLLAHRPGLADGPDAASRRRSPPGHGRAVRGRARLSRPDRLWSLVERHRDDHHGPVADGGTRADAARRGVATAPRPVLAADPRLDGRALEPGAYRWLFDTVGGGRVPILNSRAGPRSGHPVVLSHRASEGVLLGGPVPGMAAEVFGDDGQPVRGQVGELVVTRALARDDARGSGATPTVPGDVLVAMARRLGARRLGLDGRRMATGSSRAVAMTRIKMAGKRLGTRRDRIHPRPGSRPWPKSAAIGVPHEREGRSHPLLRRPAAQVTPPADPSGSGCERSRRRRRWASRSRPSGVRFVAELPKTRSGKIVRRVIRATYLHEAPGDLSSLENPTAVRAVAEATVSAVYTRRGFAVGGGFLRTGCGPGPLEPDLGNASEGNTASSGTDGRTLTGAVGFISRGARSRDADHGQRSVDGGHARPERGGIADHAGRQSASSRRWQ